MIPGTMNLSSITVIMTTGITGMSTGILIMTTGITITGITILGDIAPAQLL